MLKHIRFEAVKPELLEGTQVGDTEKVYKSPAVHAPDILIVLEGEAEAISGNTLLSLRKGEVFMAPTHLAYTLHTSDAATLYKATVPLTKIK